MRVHLRTPGNTGHIQQKARPQSRVPLTHAEQAKASEPVRGVEPLLQLQRQYGNRYVQRVLAQARKTGGAAEASSEVEHAIQRARSSGQALDSGVRAQMEPALGADFSGLRVHADAQADKLNRSLNARAFTTGQDIFFRQGEYNPGSSSGRGLLAHELTHVAQQNSAIARSNVIQRVPCETGAACPPRERSEEAASRRSSGNVETISPYEYAITDFAVGSASLKRSVRSHPTMRGLISSLLADPILHFEVIGYSDCTGSAARNRALRQQRAQSVWNFLPATVRRRGTLRGGASLSECVDSNINRAGRARNRSVVIKITTVITGEEIAVPGDPCALPARATSFAQYVNLVRCAERAFPGYSPRQMLSLLRQIYYGHESWSRTRTRFWRDVIPCGLSIPDPRATLGTTLFNALRNSYESTGTDIGHVFTGWEAMLCPRPSVELEVTGPNRVVNMPNEEFATWGGDIGSAAAQKVYDEEDRGITRPWSHYFGPSGTRVSDADLWGDIDSYVIRKGLTGAACAATPRTRITTIPAPISQILHQYYTAAATPIGRARPNRFQCFAQAIGGTVSGRRITNKSSLVRPIRIRVESFARTFYLKLVTVPLFAIGVREAMRLLLYSRQATVRFLNWVESGL